MAGRGKEEEGYSVEAQENMAVALEQFKESLIPIGSEEARDLNIPGRNVEGIYPAMDFLPLQNKAVSGEIKNSEIAEELALPPVKIHCSVLAEDAIKAAVNDYYEKNLKKEEIA